MPNFDKIGPEGKGPLTGRKQGPCNKAWSQENNVVPQRGTRMRRFGLGKNRNQSSL